MKPVFKIYTIIQPVIIFMVFFATLYSCDVPTQYLGMLILPGYFWFAYTIRVIKVYDDGVEIFFPLRFKPFYRKRCRFFTFTEIEKIVVGVAGRVESRSIILHRKCLFFGVEKKDYYFYLEDIRRKYELKAFVFLKEKGVKIDIRPEDLTPDELMD